MKASTHDLIEGLIDLTREHLNQAEQLRQLPLETLNRKPDAESWSVLECLEHLNLYGDFYLPEMGKRIRESKYPAEALFRSGLLGNYFALSMLPKDKLNKMKTFKDKKPSGSRLDKSVIDRFADQQNQLLELLHKSRAVSLNRTRTSISISNFIRLKLGDTFRFIIYHNRRHMVQAFRAGSLRWAVGSGRSSEAKLVDTLN